jgi:hypothetical protein
MVTRTPAGVNGGLVSAPSQAPATEKGHQKYKGQIALKAEINSVKVYPISLGCFTRFPSSSLSSALLLSSEDSTG